jgi:hypothetical protein
MPDHRRVIHLQDDLKAAQERIAELEGERDAIASAGHKSYCGGSDEVQGECDCGWLQRQGAHQFIENLRAERDRLREGLGRCKTLLEWTLASELPPVGEAWGALQTDGEALLSYIRAALSDTVEGGE